MNRSILITQDANEKQVAILEDGKLEEFYIERPEAKKLFGNIYAGVVKTVIPGIDAAFVDIGTGKDGFLYVGDAMRSPLDLDAEYDEDAEEKPQLQLVQETPPQGQPTTATPATEKGSAKGEVSRSAPSSEAAENRRGFEARPEDHCTGRQGSDRKQGASSDDSFFDPGPVSCHDAG